MVYYHFDKTKHLISQNFPCVKSIEIIGFADDNVKIVQIKKSTLSNPPDILKTSKPTNIQNLSEQISQSIQNSIVPNNTTINSNVPIQNSNVSKTISNQTSSPNKASPTTNSTQITKQSHQKYNADIPSQTTFFLIW